MSVIANINFISVSKGGGMYVTDDFQAYTAGSPLAGQGNWLACSTYDIYVYDSSGDKRIYANYVADLAVKRSETFSDNHYAQITLDAVNTTAYIGVAVRCQGSGGTAGFYAYYQNSTSRWCIKVINGSWDSDIGSVESVVNNAGDILRLEINGTTLTCYRNGSIDTGLSGGGVYTVSGLSGGTPGVSGSNASTSTLGDDWIGGDL